MAKKNKLQNIKAIQQMIDGTHKFQTKKSIGFSDAESTAKKAETHNYNPFEIAFCFVIVIAPYQLLKFLVHR